VVTADSRSAEALLALGLTRREAEVLVWVAEGETSPEIGIILNAAPNTIKKHVSHILEKLAVETRLSAALLANQVLRSAERLSESK
jgi:DNA-binding CsgD family transcriptional regulator